MSSNVNPSDCTPNENLQNAKESSKDDSALWKLVEAANRTKDVESGPQSSEVKEERNDTKNEDDTDKVKDRVRPNKSKVQEENNASIPVSEVKVRARRCRGRKKSEPETSAQALNDLTIVPREKRAVVPVWLSLVPVTDQNRDPAMTQTPACYLRIKDGNLPVSFIQKYLVKKHNLTSESEVEILCCGQTVSPTLPLRNLADIWLQSRPQQRVVTATVGASGKDFVLVLNYRHKSPAP